MKEIRHAFRELTTCLLKDQKETTGITNLILAIIISFQKKLGELFGNGEAGRLSFIVKLYSSGSDMKELSDADREHAYDILKKTFLQLFLAQKELTLPTVYKVMDINKSESPQKNIRRLFEGITDRLLTYPLATVGCNIPISLGAIKIFIDKLVLILSDRASEENPPSISGLDATEDSLTSMAGGAADTSPRPSQGEPANPLSRFSSEEIHDQTAQIIGKILIRHRIISKLKGGKHRSLKLKNKINDLFSLLVMRLIYLAKKTDTRATGAVNPDELAQLIKNIFNPTPQKRLTPTAQSEMTSPEKIMAIAKINKILFVLEFASSCETYTPARERATVEAHQLRNDLVATLIQLFQKIIFLIPDQTAEPSLGDLLQKALDALARLTIKNIEQYILERTHTNECKLSGRMTSKKSPGGAFTYDQKMRACAALTKYLQGPVAERDFAIIEPHQKAYCDYTLGAIVAQHAREELALFRHKEMRDDTEAVNSWFDHERGSRSTLPAHNAIDPELTPKSRWAWKK